MKLKSFEFFLKLFYIKGRIAIKNLESRMKQIIEINSK
jgi:hypothetical protein